MSTHQDDIQHIVELVNRTRVGMLSTREATGKLRKDVLRERYSALVQEGAGDERHRKAS